MSRLVIIDGNAIIHRAYHAMPPLNAPDGMLVNAVYGFAAMLIRIVTDFKPTHIAVAFDRPKPTFRKKLYKEYQATRPKMEDQLVTQISKIHSLTESFEIKIFEQDGYEADDMIGTLATKITNDKMIKDKEVIIVTGDRDILQLVVDEKILVYLPQKGLSEGKLYAEKDVFEKMGVYPSQIADYKALAGDSSDNYPGIEGIGPKTAANLLSKFKSVENIYLSLERGDDLGVSEKVFTLLKNNKENALFFKTIATIKCDVMINYDFSSLSLNSFNSDKAINELKSYGFTSLIKRIQKNDTNKNPHENKKKETSKVLQTELFS